MDKLVDEYLKGVVTLQTIQADCLVLRDEQSVWLVRATTSVHKVRKSLSE